MHWKRCLFTPLLCTLSLSAHAAGHVNLTGGVGADDYRSYALSAALDLGESGWQASVDYFTADDGATEQYGAGLEWQQSDTTSWNLHTTRTQDSQLDVAGYSGGGSWWLNPLWQGEAGTRLDLGYGYEEYTPRTRQPLPARLADAVPEQHRYSVGITQELNTAVSLYLAHDKYRYSEDPKVLARFLARRLPVLVSGVYSLLSVPETTNTLGLTWNTPVELVINLSFSKTITIIDQALASARCGLTWYLNESGSIGLAASRSRNSAVIGSAGATQVEAGENDFFEASVGMNF